MAVPGGVDGVIVIAMIERPEGLVLEGTSFLLTASSPVKIEIPATFKLESLQLS